MTNEEQGQYEHEVEFGRKAQVAYDTYIKDFLEVKNNQLRGEFINCEPNPDELMFLKNLQMALMELQTSVESDIDTGKMASRMLAEGI